MTKKKKSRQAARGRAVRQSPKDVDRRPTSSSANAPDTPSTILQKWAHSPWIIAIVAPLLTAAIFGIVKVIQSRLEASTSPTVLATASYDSNAYQAWNMSAENILSPRFFVKSIHTCGEMRQLLLATGAADTSMSHIRLHLVGSQNGTVTISGVQAEILSRTPAKPVTTISCPSAGTIATPQVALDLRQETPDALSIIPSSTLGNVPGTDGAVNVGGALGKPYFSTHIITLTKGEPFDIPITAFVAGQDIVRWRLIVDVEQGGNEQPVKVAGPVFATAPALCHSVYAQNWIFQWGAVPPRMERAANDQVSLCEGSQLPY